MISVYYWWCLLCTWFSLFNVLVPIICIALLVRCQSRPVKWVRKSVLSDDFESRVENFVVSLLTRLPQTGSGSVSSLSGLRRPFRFFFSPKFWIPYLSSSVHTHFGTPSLEILLHHPHPPPCFNDDPTEVLTAMVDRRLSSPPPNHKQAAAAAGSSPSFSEPCSDSSRGCRVPWQFSCQERCFYLPFQ